MAPFFSHTAELLSTDYTGTHSASRGVGEALVISKDGRLAAFTSLGTNVVSNDTNGMNDLYVHDCLLRRHVWDTTFGLSFPFAGGTPTSTPWDFTPDGRYFVFVSPATNLVSGFRFSLDNVYQLYVR